MTTIEAPKTTPKEVTTADVLERAADLLEEFGFCQEHPAEAQDGTCRCVDELDVHRFCMWGAMLRAEVDYGLTDALRGPTVSAPPVAAILGIEWIKWAIEPGRTKSEVVSLLRQAAERSRETA